MRICIFCVVAEAKCAFPYFHAERDEEIETQCGINLKAVVHSTLMSLTDCILKHIVLFNIFTKIFLFR